MILVEFGVGVEVRIRVRAGYFFIVLGLVCFGNPSRVSVRLRVWVGTGWESR
jgi:hypothetical protein